MAVDVEKRGIIQSCDWNSALPLTNLNSLRGEKESKAGGGGKQDGGASPVLKGSVIKWSGRSIKNLYTHPFTLIRCEKLQIGERDDDTPARSCLEWW